MPARKQQRVAVAKRVSGENEIKAKFKAPSVQCKPSCTYAKGNCSYFEQNLLCYDHLSHKIKILIIAGYNTRRELGRFDYLNISLMRYSEANEM